MTTQPLESKHTEIPSAKSKVCRLCSVALWKNCDNDQQCDVDNCARLTGTAPRFHQTEHRVCGKSRVPMRIASTSRETGAGLLKEGTRSWISCGDPIDCGSAR
jgi:hypothetical protein